jgi:hypothetical protein
MDSTAARLKKALDDNGRTIRWLSLQLAGVRGSAYASVYRYVTDPDVTPPLEFLVAAADALDRSLSWLLYGRESFSRTLHDVAGAVTDEQRADFDARMTKLPDLQTETTRLLFQNAAARWCQDRGSYEERADKVAKLAQMLAGPLDEFGTRAELEKDGRRGETDYIIAQLNALMLAMPKRGAD